MRVPTLLLVFSILPWISSIRISPVNNQNDNALIYDMKKAFNSAKNDLEKDLRRCTMRQLIETLEIDYAAKFRRLTGMSPPGGQVICNDCKMIFDSAVNGYLHNCSI